ncbi:hypothetical protein TNCV_394201 [Trichonephila clavipes]|nr:hypothetical protein TNCV_394201 [Trichonephila clavipes]
MKFIEPPTRLSIVRIRDKFETDGTIMDIHEGHQDLHGHKKIEESSVTILDSFTRSRQKPPSQDAREIGVSRASVCRISHTARGLR